jgi:nicotinamidase-related amidase
MASAHNDRLHHAPDKAKTALLLIDVINDLVIPPPEEEKDVKTAIGAARAKQARKEML